MKLVLHNEAGAANLPKNTCIFLQSINNMFALIKVNFENSIASMSRL
jgi:hypothetical protein